MEYNFYGPYSGRSADLSQERRCDGKDTESGSREGFTSQVP